MASYMPTGITYKPIESAAGLTTGYTNRDYLTQQQPVRVGVNTQGVYINLLTGQPHTGLIPSTTIGGTPFGYANNGRLVPNPAAPATATGTAAVDPLAPKLNAVVKQPGIVAAGQDLLTKQNNLSATLGKTFSDYLSEAQQQNAASKIQLATDQASINPDKISAELPQQDRNYGLAQRDISAGIGQTNVDFAKATADRLKRLSEENLNFERRSQDVANQALDLANKQTALYHLGTGTPTSGSGDLSNRYMNAYARINVPLQQQLSDRRYNQINNIEGAATRELYGNDLSFAASRSALESDVSNRNIATLKYLQGLRLQVAGMSRSMAAEYLRQLGVPIELGQRIIAGDIANLSGIQGIDERANFYGLTQPFDPSRQANVITPGISAPNRSYSPTSPTLSPVRDYGTRTGAPMTPVGQVTNVGGGYVRDANGNTFTASGQFISAGVRQTPLTPTTRQYFPVIDPRTTISQEDQEVFPYTPDIGRYLP